MLRRNLTCALSLLLLAGLAFADSPKAGLMWVTDFQHNGWPTQPFDMVLDSSDNMYFGAQETNFANYFLSIFKVDPHGAVAWDYPYLGGGFVRSGGIALDAAQRPVLGAGAYRYGYDMDYQVSCVSVDGNKAWTAFLDNARQFDEANSVACDSSGNTYASGILNEFTTALLGVAKYDASGQQMWLRTFPGIANTVGLRFSHVAVTSVGEVYVGCEDTAKVGTASIAFVHVRKYKSDGTLIWAKTFSTTHSVDLQDFAVDNAGNAYVAGDDFVNAPGSQHHIRLIKYGSDGSLKWSTIVSPVSYPSKVRVDKAGNVYVGGFEPGSGTPLAILVKTNASGVIQWMRGFAYNGQYSTVQAMTLDANGFVYIGGLARLPSGEGAYVAKYGASGLLQWWVDARDPVKGAMSLPLSIQVNKDFDVFVGGYGQEPGGWGAYAARITQTPVAQADAFATSAGTNLTGAVMTNDLFATRATAVLNTTTSGGKLSFNPDGTFSYNPGVGFTGTDNFTYNLQKSYYGGMLQSAAVKVTITVK